MRWDEPCGPLRRPCRRLPASKPWSPHSLRCRCCCDDHCPEPVPGRRRALPEHRPAGHPHPICRRSRFYPIHQSCYRCRTDRRSHFPGYWGRSRLMCLSRTQNPVSGWLAIPTQPASHGIPGTGRPPRNRSTRTPARHRRAREQTLRRCDIEHPEQQEQQCRTPRGTDTDSTPS